MTLAKWLLQVGPQFPHLCCGAAEEGGRGNREASKLLSGGGGGSGGNTPDAGQLLLEAAREIQPSSPSLPADYGWDSPGLAGGRQPEVCAPRPVLEKGWGHGWTRERGKRRVGLGPLLG